MAYLMTHFWPGATEEQYRELSGWSIRPVVCRKGSSITLPGRRRAGCSSPRCGTPRSPQISS